MGTIQKKNPEDWGVTDTWILLHTIASHDRLDSTSSKHVSFLMTEPNYIIVT